MVFILYKLYVLLPYTYPTPKLSPHRRRCISTFPQKTYICMIYKHFELWGHWKCPHKSPLLVIPMSYLCHYTNLCPHKPHKHAHTHTHTHTHTHVWVCELWGLHIFYTNDQQYFLSPNPKPTPYRKPICIVTHSDNLYRFVFNCLNTFSKLWLFSFKTLHINPRIAHTKCKMPYMSWMKYCIQNITKMSEKQTFANTFSIIFYYC